MELSAVASAPPAGRGLELADPSATNGAADPRLTGYVPWLRLRPSRFLPDMIRKSRTHR